MPWPRRQSVRVDPAFETTAREHGLLDFDAVLSRQDGVIAKAALATRQVRRLMAGERAVYVKRYPAIPLVEALAERLFGGRHRSAARREWVALHRLVDLGVPCPLPLVLGEESVLGLVRRAYVVTADIATSRTLESELMESFALPLDPPGLLRKRRLLRQLAATLARLHGAGVQHRDFYLGHLFLRRPGQADEEIVVLDLNRAEVGAATSERQRIKDLAALDFSAPPRLVSPIDRLRFLIAYTEGRDVRRRLARRVAAKSARVRRHVGRQVARGTPNFHVNE